MTTTHAIQSIIEIALTMFFIWGVWNEGTLARLEKKLFAKLFKKRNHITVIKQFCCSFLNLIPFFFILDIQIPFLIFVFKICHFLFVPNPNKKKSTQLMLGAFYIICRIPLAFL